MAGATYQKKVRCCTVLGSHLTCDHPKATSIIQRALPEPTQSTAGLAAHRNTERAAAFASVGQLELWSGTAGHCLISPCLLWSCLHPTSQHVAAEISCWWLGTNFAPDDAGHLRALLLWLRCRLCSTLLHHGFLGDNISSPAVMLQLYQVCLHNHIPWAKVPRYRVKCEPVTSVCK